jgi:hypothetical protein
VKKSPSGAIYLSDGYINVALLKPRGAVKPGLHHFGFEVENVKQAQERLRRIKRTSSFLSPTRASPLQTTRPTIPTAIHSTSQKKAGRFDGAPANHCGYLYEQEMITKKPAVDDLFAPNMLTLT